MADDDDACAVCKQTLNWMVDAPVHHDACGHYAHAGKCTDGRSDTCRACEQAAAVAPTQVGQRFPKQLVVHPPPTSVAAGGGLLTGVLARASLISGNVRNRHETPETSKDIHWLVGLGPTKAPIELLVRRGFGFNECVAEGITIDDFLRAGYTIGHLAQFPEVTPQLSSDGVTPFGVQALQALRVTASHLKTNPQQLPIEQVRAVTGLTNNDLVQRFWLAFHPNNGIQSARVRGVPPDGSWSIDQLYYLGFKTMDSFIGELGLRKLSHWHSLKPGHREVQLLGVGEHHLRNLEDDTAQKPVEVTVVTQAEPSVIVETPPQAWIFPAQPNQPKQAMRIEPDGTRVVLPYEEKAHQRKPPSSAGPGRIKIDYDY